MKTKYILILLLVSVFKLSVKSTNIYPVDQNFVISLTTIYLNNMHEIWNVTSTTPDKPIIITYSIGTEFNHDWLIINNVDDSGNYVSELLKISGTQSGAVSTLTPNGRVQVVFISDGSVCYANNPSIFSGINVSFAVNNNNIINNTLQVDSDGYISGKLGIGTNVV